MNHCAMQQNAFAACEEIMSPFAAVGCGERKNTVFCPKPRRIAPIVVGDSSRPFRWHSSHPVDVCDAKAGAELLDIFQSKGGEQSPVASSLPFFCSSPPSRQVTNPVIHDARFGENRQQVNPVHPLPLIDMGSPMSPRKSCARAKFSLKPATVRIEGFNCDRRSSSSITAVA